MPVELVTTTDQPRRERCCGSCEWWYPVAGSQTALALEGLCNCAKNRSDREQWEHDEVCEHWEPLSKPNGPDYGVIGLRSVARSLGHVRRFRGRDDLDGATDGVHATDRSDG